MPRLTSTAFLRLADLGLRVVEFFKPKPKEAEPMSARDPINYRLDTLQHALGKLSNVVEQVSAAVDVMHGRETPSDDVQLARARAARIAGVEGRQDDIDKTVARLVETLGQLTEWAGSAKAQLEALAQDVAGFRGTLSTVQLNIGELQSAVRELQNPPRT